MTIVALLNLGQISVLWYNYIIVSPEICIMLFWLCIMHQAELILNIAYIHRITHSTWASTVVSLHWIRKPYKIAALCMCAQVDSYMSAKWGALPAMLMNWQCCNYNGEMTLFTTAKLQRHAWRYCYHTNILQCFLPHHKSLMTLQWHKFKEHKNHATMLTFCLQWFHSAIAHCEEM